MKIYAVKITDITDENIYKISSFIDPYKRDKIEKFINKKDKIRTLVGEMLIRTVIGEELNIKNLDIIFQRNRYGKPWLKDYPEFNFNISHSGEFVLCAVDHMPIGVDVEKIKSLEYEGIASSFFTKEENEYIFNDDLQNNLNKFYEIWTLKESYVKCCGQGLSIPLKSFSIKIDSNREISLISDNKINEYKFKEFFIGEDYKVAVCTLNSDTVDYIIKIDQNNLINDYLEFSVII